MVSWYHKLSWIWIFITRTFTHTLHVPTNSTPRLGEPEWAPLMHECMCECVLLVCLSVRLYVCSHIPYPAAWSFLTIFPLCPALSSSLRSTQSFASQAFRYWQLLVALYSLMALWLLPNIASCAWPHGLLRAWPLNVLLCEHLPYIYIKHHN
jgi:hypothetical protein